MEPRPLGLGVLLARNVAINFVGQVVVGVVGIASVPIILGEIGIARFGVLSILWAFLTYFTVFDFGVGQATTKFVAEVLGAGTLGRLPSIVWSSLATQIVLGTGAGLALAAVAPMLAERVIVIPAPIIPEVRAALLIVAAMVPVIVAETALRGVLEGAQRYDLVNFVKVPLAVSWFIIPAVGGFLGWRLDGILLAIGVVNTGGGLAYLILMRRIFPCLRGPWTLDAATVFLLLRYGGWMALVQAVWSSMLQIDRLMIGSLLGAATLAFYTTPYELVRRLGIIPSSLIVLFPAFSAIGQRRDVELREVAVRALKFLLLSVGPAALVLVAFGGDILGLWLGKAFLQRSVLVLQVLAIGVLLSSLGTIPDLLLKGLGHPDVVAKIHLALLLPYAGACFLLIRGSGISGAAASWTIRATVETGALLWAALIYVPPFRGVLLDRLVWVAAAVIAALGLCLRAASTAAGWIPPAIAAALLAAFAAASWKYVLDAVDREQVRTMIQRSR